MFLIFTLCSLLISSTTKKTMFVNWPHRADSIKQNCIVPIDVGAKIFNFVVFHKPSKFPLFLSWTVCSSFSSFCQKPHFLFTAFYSSCLSSSLANIAAGLVCAALAVMEHRWLYFGQHCFLSASTELIALFKDSHPVRPFVLVVYALNALTICSADWHPLCHLLIF